MSTKFSKSETDEARKTLLEWLKPGDTIYTIVRHVSSSGMSRVIDLVIFKDNQPIHIAWNAGKVLGWTHDRDREGLKVGGCGMDMCFHTVYSLGRALFPDGFKLADNQHGRNGDTSGFDPDGGYAFIARDL